MAKSLQEQLMGAGLVDKKRAQKINTEKKKSKRQQPKGHKVEDENKALAKKAMQEKAERDRELNAQRKETADKKAIAAQIIQLIDTNRINRVGGEVVYQFTDGKKVKQITVTEKLRQQIVLGQLAIAKQADRYELIPKKVAEKIAQRDKSLIILLLEKQEQEQEIAEDDPYADYQIPDDLMW